MQSEGQTESNRRLRTTDGSIEAMTNRDGWNRIHRWVRTWFFWTILILGIYVLLPFLAPVFMHLGWNGPAGVIYLFYSFLCHQMPQRSFFLFGSQLTYSLPEIQSAWQNTVDPGVLRQFIGNPQMGWKVAWSDRMVSMFTSLWLFGLLWWPLRKRLRRLPWWGLVLFLLPMVIDGTSHFISDLAGISQGFRDSNAWLAAWTGHAFPASYYSGDALGSFNSWMRLLTGVLFSLGIIWFAFPYLEVAFGQSPEPFETGPLPGWKNGLEAPDRYSPDR